MNMDISVSRKIALRFFVGPLKDYVIPDLENLLKITSSKHNGLCGTPMAMLAVSALDFIGYALRPGTSQEKKGSANNSGSNIKFALTYDKLLPIYYQEEDTINLIVNVYRGKLMHHSFNMRSFGDNNYGIIRDLCNDLFIKNDILKYTYLNVDVLARDTIECIKSLDIEIRNTNDASVLENIRNSFKLNPSDEQDLLYTPNGTPSCTIPPPNIINK